MNQRLVSVAALCREVALPASVLVWMAGSGFAGMDETRVAPTVDRLAQSLTADASSADKPKLTPPHTAAVTADIMPASRLVAEASTTNATPASHQPEPAARTTEPVVAAADPVVTATAATDQPMVMAALTAPSGSQPAETPPADLLPKQETAIAMATPEPGDARIFDEKTFDEKPSDAKPAFGATEARDECLVVDPCNDRYLWSLYQRTPKEDAVTTEEQRQVTVKRKGKMVTVTRTFRKLADEDFSWKDPKAADHVGMPLTDYVIGGMDRDFKVKLVQMLRAADEAGLAPGITSAFRDDYRQSIASGLKAADNRSYHGGSLRGGYGHGLAADIVSVNGATRAERLNASQILWQWVDAHGPDFGIGRPYLGRDPPHMAPIDGNEFATHRPSLKAKLAKLAAKLQATPAAVDNRGAAKQSRAAKSPKVRAS